MKRQRDHKSQDNTSQRYQSRPIGKLMTFEPFGKFLLNTALHAYMDKENFEGGQAWFLAKNRQKKPGLGPFL